MCASTTAKHLLRPRRRRGTAISLPCCHAVALNARLAARSGGHGVTSVRVGSCVVFRNSGMRCALTLLVLVLGFLSQSAAFAIDAFNTLKNVSSDPASPMLGPHGSCPHQAITAPLSLFEAIERTLCESPQTHSAWDAVRAAAAEVGDSQSAFLPTVGGSLSYEFQHSGTAEPSKDNADTIYNQGIYAESVSLAWTLYDFGGRSASFSSSKQALIAARATQDAALQGAFFAASRDYYAVQAASATVAAAKRIEDVTGQSLAAATARFNTGVAPVTDKLLASTAYAQAVYDRVAAEGVFRASLGSLAVDMNLPPDQQLVLPDLDQGAMPDLKFVHGIHDLIDEAIRTHPTVLAAKAQWESALDNIKVTRAAGLPKVQLTGGVSRSNEPVSTNLVLPSIPAASHQASIGLSVTIPLFEGFGRSYKIRQAEVLADQQGAALRQAENTVGLGVWSSFQELETDTENLRTTDTLLEAAQEAFKASEQRYEHGVGNILELLTVQTSLARAEILHIEARANWRTARLQLAASLGTLGMWALQ